MKFYSIGYTNSITCTQMNDWKNTNGFSHDVFAGMSAQTTYYGGMGMPTVIVLGGGSAHTVFYNELGYSSADNSALITAINDALAAANTVEEPISVTANVSPNPASDVLTIAGETWTRARVLDLQGREMLNAPLLNGRLEVATLPAGAYVLHLSDVSGSMGIARFEKR